MRGIRWALEVCWEGPLEGTPLASEEGSEEGRTLGVQVARPGPAEREVTGRDGCIGGLARLRVMSA